MHLIAMKNLAIVHLQNRTHQQKGRDGEEENTIGHTRP
jgi:hypothetical protein